MTTLDIHNMPMLYDFPKIRNHRPTAQKHALSSAYIQHPSVTRLKPARKVLLAERILLQGLRTSTDRNRTLRMRPKLKMRLCFDVAVADLRARSALAEIINTPFPTLVDNSFIAFGYQFSR